MATFKVLDANGNVLNSYTFANVATITLDTAATSSLPVHRAARIADMMEVFGVNTFSALPDGTNVWGSWPADYSVASTVAGINWITAGSGMNMMVRKYHFDQWTANQGTWCPAVAAQTGAKFAMCPGMGGTSVAGILTLAAASNAAAAPWLAWVEGANEPNAAGNIPAAQTLSTQAALYGQVGGLKVLGPSIVIGLPVPEGWVAPAFFSTSQMVTLSGVQDIASVHYYPGQNPAFSDGSSRPSEFDDVTTGLSTVFGGKPLAITEWHPTLYNQHGHVYDRDLGAYLTAVYILEAYRLGYKAAIWYSMLDYAAQWGLGPCTVTAGGTGYINGTYMLGIAGGAGAAGTYTCAGGAVTAINITAKGGGFSAPEYPAPVLSFPAGGGAGAAATASVVLLSGYAAGLFPVTGGVKPRKEAWTLRAMYALTGDPGAATKRSFQTGSLPYTVNGLPPPIAGMPRTGGQEMLFQNSAGVWFHYIWNSQQAQGGTATPVQVNYGTTFTSIKEYNITQGTSAVATPVQSLAHASAVTLQLDASVRLLVLTP